jgi:hypothetical protein
MTSRASVNGIPEAEGDLQGHGDEGPSCLNFVRTEATINERNENKRTNDRTNTTTNNNNKTTANNQAQGGIRAILSTMSVGIKFSRPNASKIGT